MTHEQHTPIKIIFIDDDRDIEFIFNAFINKSKATHNLNHYFYHSTHQFIEEFSKSCRDEFVSIIFCDINMPDHNGLDILSFIKKASPRTKVYMITSSESAEIINKCRDHGADGYFCKPLELEYLLKVF